MSDEQKPSKTAASKTAASKTAASKTAASKAEKPKSGYLASLPEGWEYRVEIVGPGENRVRVTGTDVAFSGDVNSTKPVESLTDGLKAAIEGVKTLDKVTKQEAAAKSARDEMLAGLGGTSSGDEPGGEDEPGGAEGDPQDS